jgi:hypothetical protein
MLDWISDTIMAIVSYVPAIFVDRESAQFPLVRAMFGLILITAIVYAIAVLTSRRTASRYVKKVSGLFARRR